MTAFLPNDMAGDKVSKSYPEAAPVYNITVVLTQRFVSKYNVPFSTSTLIVQPFNDSEIEVIPFTVSCQVHCLGENITEACQRKHFNIASRLIIYSLNMYLAEIFTNAARPTKPNDVFGSIQFIDNITLASINWIPPLNQNETIIDHYDVTLIGNSVTSVSVAASLQTHPYKYNNVMLLEGNYSAASIEAVDLCGQRSEPLQVELFITNRTSCNPIPCDRQQGTVDALAGVLAFIIGALISSCIIIIFCSIYVQYINTGKTTSYELKSY